MANQVEVKTKLTVDAGEATSVLQRMRESFNHVSQARDTTQSGLTQIKGSFSAVGAAVSLPLQLLRNFKGSLGEVAAANHGAAQSMTVFKTTLATAFGSGLMSAVHSIEGYTHSLIDAAREESGWQKSMAGLISMTQDVPWAHAKQQAAGLADELDDIAMSTSRLPGDIKDAFTVMSEVGSASAENLDAAKKRVGELAQVARVTGIPVANLAKEFQFMEEGVMAKGGKGRLFQLLQTTGIFGDKIKGISTHWMALTDEKRTDLLNKGLSTIADRMAQAPKGMGDVLNEFHAMEEMAKESIGLPLLNAITPQLRKLVNWLRDSRGSLEEFVKEMVVDVSKFAEDAARTVREAWAYVRENSKEIKEDIEAAWGFAMQVIKFAVEHKEALAIAYGVKTVAGSQIAGQALGMGKAIYNAGAAGGVATSASGAVMGAGAVGGAVALGAFALAIAGVTAAAVQGADLMKMLDDDEKADTRARYEYFQNLSKKESAGYEAMDQNAMDHFELTKHRFMNDSKLIGMSKEEAARMADAALAQHNSNRAMVAEAEAASKAIERAARETSTGFGDQSTGIMDAKEQDALIGKVAGQFQSANAVLDTGAQQYIANLMIKSKALQNAFLESADMTSTAFTALADLTKDSAGEFSTALRGLAETAAKREKLAAKTPHVQFNGGQKFDIKQDFRDQDPDRVAVVFQRDILSAAESRYQASNASPFGV